jgi:hypothetical protein
MIRVLFCLALVGCASPKPHRVGLGLDGGVVSLDAGQASDAGAATVTYYALPTLASATAVQQTVDLALGFPKPGFNIGGGLHVLPDAGITTTYAVPQAIDGGYLYLADPVTKPLLADAGLPSPIAITVDDAGVVHDAGVASAAAVQLALPQ